MIPHVHAVLASHFTSQCWSRVNGLSPAVLSQHWDLTLRGLPLRLKIAPPFSDPLIQVEGGPQDMTDSSGKRSSLAALLTVKKESRALRNTRKQGNIDPWHSLSEQLMTWLIWGKPKGCPDMSLLRLAARSCGEARCGVSCQLGTKPVCHPTPPPPAHPKEEYFLPLELASRFTEKANSLVLGTKV